jgi:hypothetical protein
LFSSTLFEPFALPFGLSISLFDMTEEVEKVERDLFLKQPCF